MKISLPVTTCDLVNDKAVYTEKMTLFDIDTSVYSEERWEQNFPVLAQKESLFQYIERICNAEAIEKVRVVSMLKAIYCFLESSDVPTYKTFAQMFNLASPECTNRLVSQLRNAFQSILNGSSVKNFVSTASNF